ncbi:MAG TPA: dolichyl-phosphate-mannose--protein mannosyltransferase, partial [Cyanobacteria bacterium UBA10660]|nr:dolichyl-phosphate-mannose--protein mannosyltransferase [Cyanobacteria bacterium UBA10660]
MRKGLTISELLVAMAIIGVIAVLVIPGFLKDYHKKLYTTQLKKTYGMI